MKAAGSTEVGQITLLLKVNPRDKTTSIQHRATEGNCCSFHCLLQTAPTPPKHHTGHVQNTLMALCLHTATYPAPVGAEHLQWGKHTPSWSEKQEELEATTFTPLSSNTDIWLFSWVLPQKNPEAESPGQHQQTEGRGRNPLMSCWAHQGGIGWTCVKRGGEQSISQASVVSKMPSLIWLRKMMRENRDIRFLK